MFTKYYHSLPEFVTFPKIILKKIKKLLKITFYLRKFRFPILTVLRKFTYYYLILRKLSSNYRAGKKHFLHDFTLNYSILRKFDQKY
jgi:hypothetical protein